MTMISSFMSTARALGVSTAAAVLVFSLSVMVLSLMFDGRGAHVGRAVIINSIEAGT